MQKIFEMLRIIRLEQNMSQKRMVKYIGIPQKLWSNYESGKTELPMRVILKLEKLGYSIDWIIKGIGG
jgi:transcriptional regulator with XRE-family HTH domain